MAWKWTSVKLEMTKQRPGADINKIIIKAYIVAKKGENITMTPAKTPTPTASRKAARKLLPPLKDPREGLSPLRI